MDKFLNDFQKAYELMMTAKIPGTLVPVQLREPETK